MGHFEKEFKICRWASLAANKKTFYLNSKEDKNLKL